MDLIAKNKKEVAVDVKSVRETILQFIKGQLRKVEGGEAYNLKALHLYIAPAKDDRHVYESATYSAEGDRFKNECVQKIADDFAIDLPEDWAMTIEFVEELPSSAIGIPGVDAALAVESKTSAKAKTATAYITILNGEAEQEVYTIHSTDGKINIGADKKVQGADGFFRINHISFPVTSANESNKFISRQHAHISFHNETGEFLLFADEGGVPPRNKIKVRSINDSVAVKLLSTQTGHALHEGDQIMLGESAVLEFSLNAYSK